MTRRSFSRSPGRLTEWTGRQFSSAEVALAASTFVIDSLFGAPVLAKRPFTITRVVGLLSVRSDQAAALEFPFGALGFAVVSEKAATLGATAVPDPVTEVESDLWHVYQSFSAGGEASTNAGFPVSHFPIDSRAQRKVQDGENCVAVVANASAADALTYVLNYRMLLKLS